MQLERTLTDRVLAEYREMPGLRLTAEQAMRLWGVGRPQCLQVMDTLVGQGVLRSTPNGYLLSVNRWSR